VKKEAIWPIEPAPTIISPRSDPCNPTYLADIYRDTDTATFYTFRYSRLHHLHLELRVGFERRQLQGWVVLELCCLIGGGERELRLGQSPQPLCPVGMCALCPGGRGRGRGSSAWGSHPSLCVQSVCVR